MAFLRVMMRLIPEGSTLIDFPPLPDNTKLVRRHIKSIDCTDAESGLKYRREDIFEYYDFVSELTHESANEATVNEYNNVESLPFKKNSGFVPLEENKIIDNPHGISFQVSVPKVIEDHNIVPDENFIHVSVVKNNLNPFSSKKPLISMKQYVRDKRNAQSKSVSQPNYPSYMMKKCNNSSKVTHKCTTKVPNKKHDQSPSVSGETSKHINDNNIDASTESVKFSQKIEKSQILNPANLEKHENLAEDSLYSFKLGELSLTEPEKLKQSSNILQIDLSDLVIENFLNSSLDGLSISENISVEPSSSSANSAGSAAMKQNKSAYKKLGSNLKSSSCPVFENNTDSLSFDNVCSNYLVRLDDPLCDLLKTLKNFFIEGKCMLCGFIPQNSRYNAADHMKSHIDADKSCFKCMCCEQKFISPLIILQHSLRKKGKKLKKNTNCATH